MMTLNNKPSEVPQTGVAPDHTHRRWSCVAPMMTPRASFRLAVVENVLYAIGGEDGEGELLDSVERYDPSCDAWFEAEHMRLPFGMADFAVN